MRDPALHITKSNLERILQDIKYNARTTPKALAELVMEASIPYQLKGRYMKVLNQTQPTKKKIVRSSSADLEVSKKDIGRMNRVLMSVRQARNPHVNLKPILETSTDYLMLKEITVLAVRFCKAFDIDNKTDGFTEYVNIGLSLMRKYAINRFKYYDPRIHENLQNRILLASDDSKESTEEFKTMLETAMTYYSGMDFFVNSDDVNSMLNIYHARMHADELKADYEDWIIGQFEGLSFLNVVPELGQFFGENAEKRYKKWLLVKAKEENTDTDSITKKYNDYEGA